MIMVAPALLALSFVADTGRKVTFTGNVGLVNTSGNSDVTTLNLADKLGVLLGQWTFSQDFSYTYATSNDTVSASLWHAGLRGDRNFSARAGVYLLTDYDRNRFAGIASRMSPSGGLTFAAIADSSDSLRVEAGVGYTWQNSTIRDSVRDYMSGRVAVAFYRRLGGKASVTQGLEFLPNFNQSNDFRINSETAVTAPIGAGIAMKASYVVHYDGVPEPGFKHSDRILTTGVQVTF